MLPSIEKQAQSSKSLISRDMCGTSASKEVRAIGSKQHFIKYIANRSVFSEIQIALKVISKQGSGNVFAVLAKNAQTEKHPLAHVRMKGSNPRFEVRGVLLSSSISAMQDVL